MKKFFALQDSSDTLQARAMEVFSVFSIASLALCVVLLLAMLPTISSPSEVVPPLFFTTVSAESQDDYVPDEAVLPPRIAIATTVCLIDHSEEQWFSDYSGIHIDVGAECLAPGGILYEIAFNSCCDDALAPFSYRQFKNGIIAYLNDNRVSRIAGILDSNWLTSAFYDGGFPRVPGSIDSHEDYLAIRHIDSSGPTSHQLRSVMDNIAWNVLQYDQRVPEFTLPEEMLYWVGW
jgi:hypothetical protein